MRTAELAYWINQRWKMFEHKSWGGKPPHSSDPLMSVPRYCNVHRENDRVTKWIAENWRNPNANDPNLVPAMVLARMVNWPPTLDKLGFPHGDRWSDYANHFLDTFRTIRGKVWTSAYTISTCGQAIPKEKYVLSVVIDVAGQQWYHDLEGTTLEDFHDNLTKTKGLGDFLAAQVVADLKNTPGHPLKTAPDWLDWCAPGPGSLRGLAAFYGRPVKPSEFQPLIKLAYETVEPHIKEVPRIHMQDFQNCLCEFSKYMRLKEGDGRVRNNYVPESRW